VREVAARVKDAQCCGQEAGTLVEMALERAPAGRCADLADHAHLGDIGTNLVEPRFVKPTMSIAYFE
jgi:hypothetical protein